MASGSNALMRSAMSLGIEGRKGRGRSMMVVGASPFLFLSMTQFLTSPLRIFGAIEFLVSASSEFGQMIFFEGVGARARFMSSLKILVQGLVS